MRKTIKWIKRLGLLGFVFFLGKGLFWVGLLVAAWWIK